ncbi:hypothetical protein E2C01_098210 [Portunus trituberculatus]|uniref:Uncharacterized protein n=1 Tax=Portunus trituberculatus TaxID=210409 RepID=A0A5B7K730_PORTR|nr:hypothetical protein [Portunus trituberculatus]
MPRLPPSSASPLLPPRDVLPITTLYNHHHALIIIPFPADNNQRHNSTAPLSTLPSPPATTTSSPIAILHTPLPLPSSALSPRHNLHTNLRRGKVTINLK